MVSDEHQLGRSASDLSILIVGLIVSLVIYSIIDAHEQRIAEQDFQQLATSLAQQIEMDIATSAREVNHLAAFMEHSGDLSQEAFDGFAAQFLDQYGVIQALEWAPRVSLAQRAEFERSTSVTNPGFQIHQFQSGVGLVNAAQRPVYFPIHYIAPWSGNSRAHGFDIASNSERRVMLEEVVRVKEPRLSSAIRMVQENNGGFGFVAAVPVFGAEGASAVELALNDKLKGFAIGVFQFKGLIDQSLIRQTHQFGQLDFYEVLDDGHQRLVYSHAAQESGFGDLDFSKAVEFDVGGRQWKVIIRDNAASYSVSRSWLAYVFLALGLLISFLLVERMFFVRRERVLSAKADENLQLELEQRQVLEQRLEQATRELDLLSFKDPLMSISNRRHFESYLETEWKRMSRTGKPLSLIIADIDFFKRFNDHYGHVRGDECLRQIAEALTSCAMRPSDLVARYGGEEFAIVLPETLAVDALNIAQKARRKVESLQIETEMSDVSPYVTVSLGTYTMDTPNGDSPNSLIKMADKALLQAKQTGRNHATSLVYDKKRILASVT